MKTPMNTNTTTLLLQRLHDPEDQGVWEEFDARYRPILIGVGVQLGLTADEASESAQETLVQFLKDYREKKYVSNNGRLRSWLMGICRHRIMDAHRLRARGAGGRGDSVISTLPDQRAMTVTWEREQQRAIFKRAFHTLRESGRFADRTLQVFELVVIQGVPAVTVASSSGVEVAEVYRIKNRVTAKLREIVDQLTKAYQTET